MIKLLNAKGRFGILFNIYYKSRKKGSKVFSNLISNYMILKYGTYLGAQATVGSGLKFPHPQGIVIGARAVVGDNVTIYQQVTIGGDAKTALYPTISDDVIIYPGAKLIGGILVGKGSIVGANAVVIKDVPPDTTVGGVPARVISGRKHNEIL